MIIMARVPITAGTLQAVDLGWKRAVFVFPSLFSNLVV